MNLLFLVHRIPYPPNKGDKIRSYHELRYLAARHRVHLGCLVDQPEDLVHVAALRPLVASVQAVPLDPRRARLHSLTALAGREPLSVRYFASNALRRWVHETVQRESIDAVLLFSSPMFEYVRGLPLPVVMDFCDVDSDKWRQYVEHAPLPMRPVYALEARRLRAYEETVLRACRSGVLVAERERQMWASMPDGLLDKVHVIPNGVDLDFFAPQAGPPVAPEPRAIVFTGAMDYYANVDGVKYFADEVLPKIRAAVPQVHFYIVGSRPAPEVVALGSRPGITVTGFVDDVRTYYGRAAVCVVPLRIARGIQNKLLEALAMGRPVVTTRAAAEGLEPGAADALRVADDAGALARECVALLQAPDTAAALGRAGRRYVERAYLWDRALAGLEALLQDAAGSRSTAADTVPPVASLPVPSPV